MVWYLFQQRFGDNVGQLLDPNHASILKSAAAAGQPSGYKKYHIYWYLTYGYFLTVSGIYVSGKCCTILPVGYLRKFKQEASNFRGLHQSVYSLHLCLENTLLVLCRLIHVLFVFTHYQEIKTEMNPILNPRAAGPEGSLIGIPGMLLLLFMLLPRKFC